MRILLTGVTGQVGLQLKRALSPLGEIISPRRTEFDLSKPQSLRSKIRDWRPDLIVNPAAYTAVDNAEMESELVFSINADSPSVLAEEAERLGIPLIHYSTEYVFDGTKTVPYTEDDLPNPINVYGESKLKGEEYIRNRCQRHLILRTSWIYDLTNKNFLTTIRRLFREKNEVSVVDDQIGAPTCSFEIANSTTKALKFILNDSGNEFIDNSKWGLYHLTAEGQTSWYGFAKAIYDNEKNVKLSLLKAITTTEYPTPAKRPMYSLMDSAHIFSTFGIKIPVWQLSLDSLMTQ